MPAPEFSRPVRIRPLPGDAMHIEASDAERTALAQRFGLPGITSLTATIELEHDGKAIRASGKYLTRPEKRLYCGAYCLM